VFSCARRVQRVAAQARPHALGATHAIGHWARLAWRHTCHRCAAAAATRHPYPPSAKACTTGEVMSACHCPVHHLWQVNQCPCSTRVHAIHVQITVALPRLPPTWLCHSRWCRDVVHVWECSDNLLPHLLEDVVSLDPAGCDDLCTVASGPVCCHHHCATASLLVHKRSRGRTYNGSSLPRSLPGTLPGALPRTKTVRIARHMAFTTKNWASSTLGFPPPFSHLDR
jgi:hypothetical protein